MSTSELPSILQLSPKSSNIIICLPCKSAVSFHALPSHLTQTKYHRYSAAISRALIAPFKDQPVAQNNADIQPLPDGSLLHPGFPVYDGYHCLQPGCNFKCHSNKSIRDHGNVVHQLPGLHGTPLQKQQQRQSRFAAVRLQSWFNYGSNTQRNPWIVNEAEALQTPLIGEESVVGIATGVEEDLQRFHQEERQRLLASQPQQPQQYEQVIKSNTFARALRELQWLSLL
jgi:hypothetical protein